VSATTVAGVRGTRRRVLVGGVGLLLLAALAAVAWLAGTAFCARAALARVPARLSDLQSAAQRRDTVAAAMALQALQADTALARRRTSGPIWSASGALPWVGSSVGTARSLTVASDLIARTVLPALVDIARTRPSALLDSGRIDLVALRRLAPQLQKADSELAAVRRLVGARSAPTALPAVDEARAQLERKLADVAPSLHSAAMAARLMPSMLGADGPRRYFLAFQTNAEARGTGGLVGAFAIVTARDGRLRVDHLGDNSELRTFTAPVTDPGPQFRARYDQFASTMQPLNSNLSPDFPRVAGVWAAMWQKQTGERVDGVVATDPVALSYLLSATGGPLVLADGERIGAAQMVQVTESEAYRRFATDNAARKAYLQAISSAAFDKLLGDAPAAVARESGSLLAALRRAVDEGRLLVNSRHEKEQTLLEQTPLSGQLPDVAGPFAGVVVNNAGADKLEYYLDRTVRYSAGACTGTSRNSTVELTLHSAVPRGGLGLPDYVVGRPRTHASRGANHLLVSLFATRAAFVTGVDLDGKAITVAAETERGHPVFTADIDVMPGATVTLRYRLLEPTAPGEAIVPRQPLVRPIVVATRVPVCG